jgi:hypothetical protein
VLLLGEALRDDGGGILVDCRAARAEPRVDPLFKAILRATRPHGLHRCASPDAAMTNMRRRLAACSPQWPPYSSGILRSLSVHTPRWRIASYMASGARSRRRPLYWPISIRALANSAGHAVAPAVPTAGQEAPSTPRSSVMKVTRAAVVSSTEATPWHRMANLGHYQRFDRSRGLHT